MSLLEVRDLRTVFHTDAGVVKAVDGVSFSVEKGKTLGIVGESGCGKSVTSLSVMRLVPQPPGEIVGGQVMWKGKDLLKLPIDQMPNIRGSEISMIFQDPMSSLNPVFKIGKQLGEVLEKRFNVKGKEAFNRMVSALELVGISEAEARLSAYPHELSGGMKQRVMIAMALMTEPDLLIADEPTTALDVTVQAQILYLMKELQEKFGTSIILITHDMGVVAETCDDVAVMYAGRVVEHCSIFDLFEKNRHPYTNGLLKSIPKIGLSKDEILPTIDGLVPSLIHPPEGCRYAERCDRAQDKCRQDDPRLNSLAPGHEAACHFPMEVDA